MPAVAVTPGRILQRFAPAAIIGLIAVSATRPLAGQSNLSSRFVSVFYGELEPDGTLIYVNAGHQTPLLFDAGGVHGLSTGGTVIGPLPDARFRRGYARLEPGAILVLCTDGILERRDSKGEFFGEERLRQLVIASARLAASEILERVYEAASAFGAGRGWDDDATAVIVKRLS